MSVSSLSASSSSRPSKQPRLDVEPVPLRRDTILPSAVKFHVASFLPFKEAIYFLGKQGSFEKWQKAKQGIDISDWPARKGNLVQQKKWDDEIFPRISARIKKVADKSWVKNLCIAHLSDEQLIALSPIPFPHVKSLRLQLSSSVPNYSRERTDAIAQLTRNSSELEQVTIGRSTDDETLVLIQNCSRLTALKIENRLQWKEQDGFGIRQSWDWKSIATELAKKPSFEQLRLGDGSDLSREQAVQIAQIPQLRNMTVSSEIAQDSTFEAFTGHSGLEEVRLVGLKQITDVTMRIFSKLPSLTSMEISSSPRVTPHGVLVLMGAEKLSCLTLGQFEMRDCFLKSLSYFPSLTSLHLMECTAIGDAGLKELGSRSKLRELEIFRRNGKIAFTDEGLAGLAASRELEHLKLRNPPRREKIDEIMADQNAWKGITSEGVKKLVGKSKSLRILDIPRFLYEKLKSDLLAIRPDLKLSFAGVRQ